MYAVLVVNYVEYRGDNWEDQEKTLMTVFSDSVMHMTYDDVLKIRRFANLYNAGKSYHDHLYVICHPLQVAMPDKQIVTMTKEQMISYVDNYDETERQRKEADRIRRAEAKQRKELLKKLEGKSVAEIERILKGEAS